MLLFVKIHIVQFVWLTPKILEVCIWPSGRQPSLFLHSMPDDRHTVLFTDNPFRLCIFYQPYHLYGGEPENARGPLPHLPSTVDRCPDFCPKRFTLR